MSDETTPLLAGNGPDASPQPSYDDRHPEENLGEQQNGSSQSTDSTKTFGSLATTVSSWFLGLLCIVLEHEESRLYHRVPLTLPCKLTERLCVGLDPPYGHRDVPCSHGRHDSRVLLRVYRERAASAPKYQLDRDRIHAHTCQLPVRAFLSLWVVMKSIVSVLRCADHSTVN